MTSSRRPHASPTPRRAWLAAAACALLVACGGSSGGGDGSAEPEVPPPPLAEGFHVGYGEAFLDLPVGVSLGGYGSRYDAVIGQLQSIGGAAPRVPDARPSPYALLLPPSIGIHTMPKVQALSFARVEGERVERLVLVNLDAIFTTSFLRDAVLERVEERTGVDLGDALHIACSHTHASGAGFYNNVFGAVALDTYFPEIFDRFAVSIADVVVAALGSQAPGRIGAAFLQGFDPADAIYKDRRAENDAGDLVTNSDPSRADLRTGELLPDGVPDGKIKDGRLAVFRVERADGTPLAAVVHFPIHGTSLTGANLFLSTDAPGIIEDKARERIGVPVLHFQGSSGDIQPELDLVPTVLTPTPGLSKQFQMMERVGERAASVIGEVWEAIEVTDAPRRLRSGTTTFRQDRQLVGYDQAAPPYDQFDAPFGALFCGLLSDAFFFLPIDPPGDIDSPFQCLSRPVTLNLDFLSNAVSGLIFPLLTDEFGVSSYTEDILADVVTGINPVGGPYEEPGDLFHARVSFFQIDGVPVASAADPSDIGTRTLSFVAMPGEATTPWSFETRRKLALRVPGLVFEDLFVVSYTNDFQSYLVNKEDWLFGGSRELGTMVWGPLWSEYVRERVIDLSEAIALDRPVPPGPEIPESDPVPFIPPRPVPSPRTGLVVGPGDTSRFGTVTASFYGGDPLVDRPHVVVEVDDGSGQFVAARAPGGRPIDEAGYELMLRYEYDESNPAEPHLWSVAWLLTENDATGRYRLRVEGRNYDGSAPVGNPARFGGAPYGFASPAFEVRPAPIGIESVALGRSTLEVDALYPVVPDIEDPNVPDAFRDLPERPRRSEYSIRVLDGARTVLAGSGELGGAGRGALPGTLAPGRYDVEIDVRDAFGNAGSARFLDVAVGG